MVTEIRRLAARVGQKKVWQLAADPDRLAVLERALDLHQPETNETWLVRGGDVLERLAGRKTIFDSHV